MVENNIDPEEINNSEDYVMARLEEDVEPRPVKVLDLIDPNVPRADSETRKSRMSICKSCEKFKAGTICSECNCVMKFKTWLQPAACPLGKW